VGGAGYVTDVAAFNWLRDEPLLGGTNPIGAKVAAVVVAMVVTYLGNRLLTWRDLGSGNRRREVALFMVFNLVGLMISVVALDLSHNVLGLTSRLADNISGNVVGVGLGTAFRYWAYKRFVFVGDVRPTRRAGQRSAATIRSRALCWVALVVGRRGPAQWTPYRSPFARSRSWASTAWRRR
jgi:putative flippase GtrA